MTYIVRLMDGLHCKAWILVEVCRCVHSVMITILFFDPHNALDSEALSRI
jgi:hypothetical protein